MKKLDLSIPFALAALLTAILCAGCSDNPSVAGTAEEPNELAQGESSSSSEPLQSSSSEKGSESVRRDTTSLEFYIEQFGIDSLQFNGGVLAATADFDMKPPTQSTQDPDHQAARETEFDTPWPHAIVKQNVEALNDLFPKANEQFAGLVDSIRNGTTSDSCGLYVQSVWGDSKTIGFILADVSRDPVSIIDIASSRCKETTENKVYRFLFRYCGEIDSHPEIVHTTVQVDIPADKCPDQRTAAEWLKDE